MSQSDLDRSSSAYLSVVDLSQDSKTDQSLYQSDLSTVVMIKPEQSQSSHHHNHHHHHGHHHHHHHHNHHHNHRHHSQSDSDRIKTDQHDSRRPSKSDHNHLNHLDQRDQWGGQFEFLLACLGNAVGLGNCWRFPYLCYKNGGGAFLIPYMICCLVIGLPLFMIELGLGQFSSMGPGQLWANLAPISKGIGLASIISSAIVAIYYNMIIAWTLFYFVETFLGQKWQICSNSFNSEYCFSTLSNQTSSSNPMNWSISSTEEFFNDYVLAKSNGLEEMTMMNWKLVLALFFSWTLVALALIKGIQSSGKVVYFTATFPYVILAILLGRGLTLPGSFDGLRYYITPNWDESMMLKFGTMLPYKFSTVSKQKKITKIITFVVFVCLSVSHNNSSS
ncbi:hypothetical protein SSS_07999 [Sarcoptes scabiei]|nr:hypothetical protein SSS_07999 [Sarcoptes scabiei]